MDVRVEVDRGLCMSSGRCVSEAPDHFAFDDDDLARPTERAAGADLATLTRIARSCPTGAIAVAVDGTRVDE